MGNLPGVIIQWHRVGHAGITRAISASREGASANKWLLDVSFYIWTIRSLDVSFPGRFILKMIRTLDDSFFGCFVLWTFHSFVDNVI